MPQLISNLYKIVLGLGILGITILLWGYVQVEVYTASTPINGPALCNLQSPVKYSKFLSYENRAGRAELICIRTDTNTSTYHKLNYKPQDYSNGGSWVIVYSQLLYTDNALTWPIYL